MKKEGVIILLLVILFLFSFSFISAKKPKDNINVSIDFQTSQVIRQGDIFQSSVTIKNYNRYKPIIIKEIIISDENNNVIETLKVNKKLKSLKSLIKKRDKLIQYSQNSKLCKRSKFLQKRIYRKIKKINSEIEEQTFHESFNLNINDFKDNLELSNTINVSIVIKYKVGYRRYSFEDSSSVLISEPLPLPPRNSPGWYVGDQHMHSNYGSTIRENPDSLEDMIEESIIKGLNWVIFTDHSVSFSKATEWEEGRNTCLESSTPSFKCLYGQEMSIGAVENECDSWSNSHLLAHPSNDDEFNYINGYCGFFQCDDCRDEQTVINEVNSSGGFGIIAHPYGTRFNWKNWSLRGYSGLEIINSKVGVFEDDDEKSIYNSGGEDDSWVEFLNNEENPDDGFIIAVAGSDAHHINEVGHTFTYCYIDSEILTTSAIRKSYENGNCIASTGPFLAFTFEEYIIGDVVRGVSPGIKTLNVQSASNSEFGDLEELHIYVDENLITTVPLSGIYYSEKIDINLEANDNYIRMEVHTTKDKRAYTNPIWFDVINYGEPLFEVKDSANKVVAYFDDIGNLNLLGTCKESSNCISPENSFIVENSDYETVAYIDPLGNLCLESDSCRNYFQTTCNPSTDAFLIQNNSINLGYIDFNGELCLIGRLIENI